MKFHDMALTSHTQTHDIDTSANIVEKRPGLRHVKPLIQFCELRKVNNYSRSSTRNAHDVFVFQRGQGFFILYLPTPK